MRCRIAVRLCAASSQKIAAVDGTDAANRDNAPRGDDDVSGLVRLERRWNVATLGTEPLGALVDVQKRHEAALAARSAAASVPTTFVSPRVNFNNRAKAMLRREAALLRAERAAAAGQNGGGTTEAADRRGPHIDPPTQPQGRPGLSSSSSGSGGTSGRPNLIAAAEEEGVSGVTNEASADAGDTAPPSPADLRELMRRAEATGLRRGHHGAQLAAMDADTAEAMRRENELNPVDPQRSIYEPWKPGQGVSASMVERRERNGRWVHTDTVTAAVSKYVPPTRFSAEELTSPANEQRYDELQDVRLTEAEQEKVALSPTQAVRAGTFDYHLRRASLRTLADHPINHLIEAQYVAIFSIFNPITGQNHIFPENERELMTAAEGCALAEEHSMDLIQRWVSQRGDKKVAVCCIADANSYVIDEITAINNKQQIAGAYSTLEVGFTGGSDGHALWFKSRETAMLLQKGHPIRVVLRKYGTPREGFPVLETILGRMKAEADRLSVRYTAGKVRADEKGNLVVHLQPSSERMPLSATTHPTQEEMLQAMQEVEYARQYDTAVTLHYDMGQELDRRKLARAVATGTAWTLRSDGLPIRKERRMKAFQGMIPKGRKLWRDRGDVEADFMGGRSVGSPTGIDRVQNPRELNTERARRGHQVLRNRLEMGLSDLVDQGETEGETSTIMRTRSTFAGNALEVGELKRSVGLKRNRLKFPRKARGFATIGVDEPDGIKTAS